MTRLACIWLAALWIGMMPIAALSQDTHVSSEPTPISDPAIWITAEDWPRDLWLAEIEGSVGVVLDVDEFGLVARCRIFETSGYVAMDSAVCEKIEKVARFEPVQDENGISIPSEWRKSFAFKFNEDEELLPP